MKKKMNAGGLKSATAKLKKKSYGGTKKMNAGGGKPDYLDLDGDGNKKEPMKQAAKQKKMGGGYMQPSKEVKFGGPSKKQAGGTAKQKKVTAMKSGRRGVVTQEDGNERAITRRGRVKGRGDKRGFTTRSTIVDAGKGTITKEVMKGRGRADGKGSTKTKTKTVRKNRAAGAAARIDRKANRINKKQAKTDKKFLGGRLAGAIKGFRGGKGQGLKARLAGAAKGAAGGGMMGRAIGAMKGAAGAGKGSGFGGRLRGAFQGAKQGAFGQAEGDPMAQQGAPMEENMEAEMKRGGKRKGKKMKDRRRKKK